MSSEGGVGLAIIGQVGRAHYLGALDDTERARLVGAAPDRGLRRESSPVAPGGLGPEAALRHPEVGGIIICAALEERDYWIRRVASAGKAVLCQPPVAPTCARAVEVVEFCASRGVPLGVAADLLFSPLATGVGRVVRERHLGPLLFVDLKVAVPQDRLRDVSEGVLLSHGTGYLSLLLRCFGELDWVYGRTRSLGLNRPTEDVVVAQLRFRSGMEGLLQINGLERRGGADLEVYGVRGKREFRTEEPSSSREGLRSAHRDFVGALQHGRAPAFGGLEAAAANHLVDWIRQSARLEREVSAKEVRIAQ